MSKTKKTILISAAVIILVCISPIVYKIVNPVYLLPEPSLGPGIYRLIGVYSDKGLTTFYGNGLVWSPNGKYIAGSITKYGYPDFCFACGRPYSEIFIIDIATMKRQTVLWGSPDEFGNTISWLPDGEHIAYTDTNLDSGWGIRSVSVDGKDDAQFMTNHGHPVWNPNGSKIAMIDATDTSGNWYPVINIIDLSTGKSEQVFKGGQSMFHIYSLSWSADGNTLVFTYGTEDQNYEPNANIFLFDVGTKELTQIKNDNYEYWSAYFSPKGRFIALERYDGPVTIKDLNTTCEVKLPINNVNSFSWSPDDQEMVISSDGDVNIVDLSEFIGPKFKETGSICP